MKVAFVVFARNKAPWIGETIHTVLRQTYSPMQLVFSDQGSEDGTLEVIKRETAKYNGPNEVLILECPKTEHRQHPGLIEHINWLHNRLDADYWITIAADDHAFPDRAKRTVETIEELREPPLFFATKKYNVSPGKTHRVLSETVNPKESCYVGPIRHLEEYVGGSCSGAWRPDLLDLFPLNHGCLLDVYMPFCAALKASFYYLAEVHHAMVMQDDPDNMGLEGVRRQAIDRGDVDEQARIEELIHYQLTNNLWQMYHAVEGYLGVHQDQRPRLKDVTPYLQKRILIQSGAWIQTRQDLHERGVDPMRLVVK